MFRVLWLVFLQWIPWLLLGGIVLVSLGRDTLRLGGLMDLWVSLEAPQGKADSPASQWNRRFLAAVRPYQGGIWFWSTLFFGLSGSGVLVMAGLGIPWAISLTTPVLIVCSFQALLSWRFLPQEFPFPDQWDEIVACFPDLRLQPYTWLWTSWTRWILVSLIASVTIYKLYGGGITGFLLFFEACIWTVLVFSILFPRIPSKDVTMGAFFPPLQLALSQRFGSQAEFTQFLSQVSISPDSRT
ncbi:hypothetical protein NRY68_15815 [Acidithiobacillus ferrooxidans]|jgi:hypothetical protein|uniref:hypothetical protein n=1 Tax=Acidithiobacillus ferrooxidans TaxID=920 RepID=UPI0021478F9E|nr:hypothetical protein [Acidithiobacillus ferrooxidans]MCR1347219.1 hypothetical protein [Acidithiobacillus ferrooxidans]MCR1356044.1 hypothetical protein [Acidithiobacillus ferrooxidans]